MAIPNVLILDDCGIAIGDGAATEVFTELGCVGNHIELAPDTSITTLDTFCGSVDLPGATKWALVATFYQSFDPDATEEALAAAVAADKPVGFKVLPRKGQPVSATNPLWSGKVMPQPYPPISGDAGDASTIEIEWGITEGPTKAITGTYPTAAAAEAETGTATAKEKAKA